MGELIGADLSLLVGPEIEPLDLAEVKKHLRFSSSTEDTLLDGWISAARQYFEEQTGRQVIRATWELTLDAFPYGVIELPKPPLYAVESVSYLDQDGVLQSWGTENYTVRTPSGHYARRGYVQRVFGISWPVTRTEEGAVRVRFQAGYGSAPGDVPELVRTLLYLLVANFHKYRSETIETRFESAFSTLPLGAEAFIRGFRDTALPKRYPRYGSSWA